MMWKYVSQCKVHESTRIQSSHQSPVPDIPSVGSAQLKPHRSRVDIHIYIESPPKLFIIQALRPPSEYATYSPTLIMQITYVQIWVCFQVIIVKSDPITTLSNIIVGVGRFFLEATHPSLNEYNAS